MKKIFTLIFICIMILGLASCKSSAVSTKSIYKGDGTFDPAIVKDVSLIELINTPDTYAGTFIAITGKILTECSVGCWFFLADENNNQMHVTLSSQNFSIPQAVGKKVKVIGVFESTQSNLNLSAFQVEFIK
jgi:hypothetical protein